MIRKTNIIKRKKQFEEGGEGGRGLGRKERFKKEKIERPSSIIKMKN